MAPETLKKGSVFERRNEEIRNASGNYILKKVEYVSVIITYFVVRRKIGKKMGQDHRHIENTHHLTVQSNRVLGCR